MPLDSCPAACYIIFIDEFAILVIFATSADRKDGCRLKKTRLLAAVLLAVVLTGLFAGTALADSSTLTVGVRDDIVNFGFLNETTGKYYGLEIDLAKELASRLGKSKVEFVSVTPATRREMLESGQVDCLAACYSITETRQEVFDFSQPYYHDDTVFMVQSSSLFTQREDLAGMTVGVLAGSNTGALVDEVMQAIDPEGVKLREMDSYQDLSDALERGEVDAVCMDGCIAQAYMNEDRIYLPGSLATQYYGVATQKDSALSAQVAGAIEDMLADGTVDTLIDKWD